MPDLTAWLGGLFGLLIGSFLNVCIHRWPQDLSVVAPRSRCPHCAAQIAWYDNIPVLSWLLLRGRCRACQARIHWRYPAVELLTGSTFTWFIAQHGLTLTGAKDCVFAALLIGLAFADADTRILPDEMTLGGALIGFVFSFFVPVPDETFHFLTAVAGWAPPPRLASAGEAVLGGCLCAGSLWLAGWLFEKLRHKEGLGFGDVKMLVMIGAFLGTGNALITIVLGSLLGSIVGLAWIRITKSDAASYELPFGTFLAAAAFFVAVWGERMMGWYLRTIS